MTWFSELISDFTIYALQVCMIPTYKLHILDIGERRHDIFCHVPEIPHIMREGICYYCLSEDQQISQNERLGEVIQRKLWNLFWKLMKNSRMKVKQRTWDMVLDLIVLSLICQRLKKRRGSPIVSGNIKKEEKIKWFHTFWEGFLNVSMCVCEKFKHWSNY